MNKIVKFFGKAILYTSLASIFTIQVADFLQIFDIDWFSNNISKITILLLSLLFLYILSERRVWLADEYARIILEIKSVNQKVDGLSEDALSKRLQDSGVVNIYRSRDDYQVFRGYSSLFDYLASSRSSIHIFAHWLGHGVGIEGIAQRLASLVRERSGLTVEIAIVDPESALLPALGAVLGITADEAVARAQNSKADLIAARDSLNVNQKRRYKIKKYTSLPCASIIMLDCTEDCGRIQIDYKLFGEPRQNSFGFEVMPRDGGLFERYRESTLRQIALSSDI